MSDNTGGFAFSFVAFFVCQRSSTIARLWIFSLEMLSLSAE